MGKVFYESDYVEALTHRDWLDSLIVTFTDTEDVVPVATGGGFVQPANLPAESQEATRARVAFALGLTPLDSFISNDAKQVDNLALALRTRLYPKLDRVPKVPEVPKAKSAKKR